MTAKEPTYLESSSGKRLAYFKTEGSQPTVVMMGGLMSDMTGTKALYLEELCRGKGWGYIRFDYSGHGQSSGVFKDGTIGLWHKDALEIIDNVTEGPIVVVGSSMGGWQALLAALARPDRIKGLVGLASAPDFTKHLFSDFSQSQLQELGASGEIRMPSDYGDDPYIFTKALFEDGREHLLLDNSIPLNIPVRLIHGLADSDVPHQVSEGIMARLEGVDKKLTLIKGAGHSLSEPDQLDLLKANLEDVVEKVSG